MTHIIGNGFKTQASFRFLLFVTKFYKYVFIVYLQTGLRDT